MAGNEILPLHRFRAQGFELSVDQAPKVVFPLASSRTILVASPGQIE